MRVPCRGHSPGHDEDSFTLYDDIRQGVRDKEVGGTSLAHPFRKPRLIFVHAYSSGEFIPLSSSEVHSYAL